MKRTILNRLAFKSMKAHRNMFFSYFLSSSLLFGLLFILLSLFNNSYLQENFPTLQPILGIGLFFAAILTLIIVLYSSRFLQKNQVKEFGVYHVLGLEKKHVRWILLVQNTVLYLATLVTSLLLGYFLGHFAFMLLNRMMQNTGIDFMDFEWSFATFALIAVLVTLAFAGVHLLNARSIQKMNPIQLLQEASQPQAQPKNRYLMVILGLVSVAIGYYIALFVIEDFKEAVPLVFAVLLFVILGTYLLFLSLSTLILKAMKKNKNYYYRTQNFLTVSGMVHRLGNNAASLATISILSSGVIMVFGCVLTLYSFLNSTIGDIETEGYMVTYYHHDTVQDPAHPLEEIYQQIERDQTLLTDQHQAKNYRFNIGANCRMELDQGQWQVVEDATGEGTLFTFMTRSSYESEMGESLDLEPGQVAVADRHRDLDIGETLKVEGKSYPVQQEVSDRAIPTYDSKIIGIVFATDQDFVDFLRSIGRLYEADGQTHLKLTIQTSYDSPVDMDQEEYLAYVNDLLDYEHGHFVAIPQKAMARVFYALYGGLLFIGLMVGLVLMVGILLMLYFKQMEEGLSDRKNYQIMKQVGLPDSDIKKTISKQVLWVFFLPLLVALINNAVATKPIYYLFAGLGLVDIKILAGSFAIAAALYALIYFVFYLLTSRAYYQLVNQEESQVI